jgi:uncharacterized protein YbjT (DUF2867 family)
MTLPRKTLVTGANGRTGRAVIQALAAVGAPVRAFVRREGQGPDLLALGASEIAVGDLSDAASLKAAAQDCDTLIHIGPPMHPEEVAQTGHALKAARAAGAGHFVYYSVMHPLRREVRHHRLKLDAEEEVIESGLPYTILQPCRYMQHLEPIWSQVTEQGVHPMPFGVDKRFSLVDVLDLAAATAKVVVEGPAHHWATYELAGPEALSMRDVADELSLALGRPVEARQISLDDLAVAGRAKGLDEDRIQQMQVMNRHYDAHGFLGNANVLTWLLGRPPTPFKAYVERLIARA